MNKHIIILSFFCLISLSYEDLDYKTFINDLGLKLEEDKITTEDRYINTVWILTSSDETNRNGKSIILQHGFLDSGWTWLVLGKKSVAYILANEGYIVYIHHIRGTQFSHEHLNYNSIDPLSDYWEFSFDQMAQYDLPALVNYIKKRDGVEKVDYFGHSQGTLMFFLAYMNDPDFMEHNINKFAGVGTVPNINNAPHKLVELIDKLNVVDIMKIKNVLVLPTQVGKLIYDFCTGAGKNLCIKVLNAGIGDTGRINYDELLEVLPFYEPGGTSLQNCRHWIQLYKEKKVRKYDYGTLASNIKHYGLSSPQTYDIIKMNGYSIPSIVTTSDADPFCNPKDTLEFLSNIDNQDVVKVINLKNYGHLDYIWSDDGYNEVLPQIFNFLNK